MMILDSDIFFLGGDLLDSTTAIQLWLSSNTLQNNSGFGSCISKIKYASFINTSNIKWLNAIYSSSVVLKKFMFVT